MTRTENLARALDADDAWLQLGCEVIETPHARIVRSPSEVSRPFGCVLRISAASPAEIAALFTDVQRELAACERIDYRVDAGTPPPFEAHLALEGYACQPLLLMLLEGDLPGSPLEHDLRPVDTDEAWRDWFALNAINRPDDDSVARARSRKCPPVRYWQAYVDGDPAGFFSSWEGTEGVGVTENLDVREEYRGRGIATSLMHRCVADARSRGARAVTLGCNPNDWPKTWYARLGFVPIGMSRIYTGAGPTGPASSL